METVRSERFGILNLNRQFHASNEPPALTWVKTSVDSDRDQQKQVSLGWIGQTWVFVNGSLITSGKNFYYPESERRSPDGTSLIGEWFLPGSAASWPQCNRDCSV